MREPAVALTVLLNVFVFLFEIVILFAVAVTAPVNVFVTTGAGETFEFWIKILVPAVSVLPNVFVTAIVLSAFSIVTVVPAETGALLLNSFILTPDIVIEPVVAFTNPPVNVFLSVAVCVFVIEILVPAVTVLLNAFLFVPEIVIAPKVLDVAVTAPVNMFAATGVAFEFLISM
jgi:hypothetical protein